MLEWLIVGGGVHGTYYSHYLTGCAGVPREKIRVLDPAPEPLTRWYDCCSNTGMSFMRSPDVHHLDIDPLALRLHCFATTKEPYRSFLEPYSRPSFALFRAHTTEVIERHRLREFRLQGRATGLRFGTGYTTVGTTIGNIAAKRVLLAIGASEQPHWPAWARQLRERGAPINHVFGPAFKLEHLHRWQNALVLGGGITAAQTALALAKRAPGTVTLLMRHSLRIETFDADPCWIGSRCLNGFERKDYPQRRRMIADARNRGSVPSEIAVELFQAIENGFLTLLCGDVAGAELTATTRVKLMIETFGGSKDPLTTDQVVLATGFETSRPGGEWLSNAIEELELPCSDCGYPILDKTLCWHSGLYVSGPLAELEIGPVARNIVGARLAARRFREVSKSERR